MGKNNQNNQPEQFGMLAGYYDVLNGGANYRQTADYIEKIFSACEKKPRLVLDLACGTGNLSLELDRRGYDMTGLDLSADMLAAAAAKKNAGNILWINQDMRAFELYGTVDAVVCCFDSLNYILSKKEIKKCFGLVYNYLNPGGLFAFDVNSKYKFEHIYAKNNFVVDNTGAHNIFCSWRNHYDKKAGICDFHITLFVRGQSGGLYKRYDEMQRERYYSEKFLKKALAETGFANIKRYCDFDFKTESKSRQKRERLCFAAVKI